ncbi:small ribosomal subunit protein uS7m-like [Lineus longissimus]|uniref:small ribosomal subunit protein uS7m-like n=1 Tax=Lineus longissimus TaxID=88925 RepID=UPI002B4DBE2E
MASTVQHVCKLLGRNVVLNPLLISKTYIPMVVQTRSAKYHKQFLEPTLDKAALAQPLPEDDVRRFQPIKAARSMEHTLFTCNPEMEKFINIMMEDGKKQLARNLLEQALKNVKRIQIEKYHKSSPEDREQIILDPVDIFNKAVENCRPVLILTKIVKGGVTYQVPVPCKPNYSRFKAMNWLINSGMEKDPKMRFYDKLAYELIEAANNEGKSVRKKQDLHKQCEANRAYAHFRW